MQKISKAFPLAGADIIFISSDGVRYGLHSKNLECNTGGFPAVGPTIQGQNDPVTLEESSSVLDLLFAFVYPTSLPIIEDMSFSTIMGLAEAAEKYQVHSAIYACRMCLRHRADFIQEHSIEIALLSAKHDYEDILKLTAPHAIKVPLSTIVPLLPERLLLPWIKYQEAHRATTSCFPKDVADQDHSFQTNGYGGKSVGCYEWPALSAALCTRYSGRSMFTESDVELMLAAPVGGRRCCQNAVENIRQQLLKRLRGMKPFPQFIRENY